MDDINTRVPPNVWGDGPGFAYGAFLLGRFTTYNDATHDLSLAYLMGLISLNGTVVAPRPHRAWREKSNTAGEGRR